jgi:hypothetical protein
MSQDQPSDSPGNSPCDSDDRIVPQPGARTPGSPPSNPAKAVPVPTPGLRGFTVQPGGRNSIAGTAERIGSAVGAVQRQVRRGLELVRPAEHHGRSPSSGNAGQFNPAEEERYDLAARMMQAIEAEVAEARRQAAHRPGHFSGVAAGRLQQFRDRLRDALSRSRLRTRRLAADYPVPTIVAIAGSCLAFGLTLRLWNSRRR